MNDIQLRETTKGGKYDWNFGWNDVDTVRGTMQLVNAVRHAILLRRGELSQDLYTDKGCEAHEYIYKGNSTEEQEQEAKIIENTVESVSGVYDATCKLTTNTELETNIELNIITEEYEEVNINGI